MELIKCPRCLIENMVIGISLVRDAGQEQRATELFPTDGKEHLGTLSPGVLLTAKWIGARTIETAPGGTFQHGPLQQPERPSKLWKRLWETAPVHL